MQETRHPSIAREDYLQTILQLQEEEVPVIRARLAERLKVSAPSVSEAIRSLEDDDLVSIHDQRRIKLTESGLTMAENIVRRHRVAERILTDLLGMSWSEAHEEAHRLEHGLSDRVVDAAMSVLGNPTTCPHGSPIPGSGYSEPEALPLAEVDAEARVRIERVGEGIEIRKEIMRYLDANGLRPGVEALVVAAAPDGTYSIDIDDHALAIGPPVTEQIFVAIL